MAKDTRFWTRFIGKTKASGFDKNFELDEGLKGLSWFENSRKVVRERIKKTQETLGEEIGNSITHGIMALFILGMIPYAAIRAYINAPVNKEIIDAISISVFMITTFLMYLVSLIYHFTSNNTVHKRVLRKIDPIFLYLGIAGAYTPICLSLIGGTLGIVICVFQWILCISGILFLSLTYIGCRANKFVAVGLYVLMNWMVLFYITSFRSNATLPTFWLVISGMLVYTVGILFLILKFKFAHMIWHFCEIIGTLCEFIGLVYFLR